MVKHIKVRLHTRYNVNTQMQNCWKQHFEALGQFIMVGTAANVFLKAAKKRIAL